MSHSLPRLGCTKETLPTPCLCLDLDRFDANVGAMVAACSARGIQWRPHGKCHKSPVIARWLVEAGACGVTCATVHEAEIMAEAGVTDLLIANMVAGPVKLARLMDVAAKADVIVCVDHPQQAIAMSESASSANRSIRVLVELEIGMNRVGIAPDERAVALAQQIVDLPGLRFAGLMAYEGHLLTIKEQAEKESAIRGALGEVVALSENIADQGLPCQVVSCGGTGSYPITLGQQGITEIQAGGAIFMDAFYRDACQITDLQNALTVLATVVSLPTPDRVIIDAGRKAMNAEIHTPQVISHTGVTVDWLSAEHGVLKRTAEASHLEIGQQIELIPGYADLTNVLHSQFYGFRNGKFERVIPIVR